MNSEKSADFKATELEAKAEKAVRRSFWDTINPGYVVAGLTTIIASWLSIDGHFYKNLNDDKAYKNLKKERRSAMETARETAYGDRKSYTSMVSKAENGYLEKLDKAVLKDTGISHTMERFSALKTHQKWQVGLTMAAVVFVGMGAVYGYASQRRLNEKLNKQIEKNSEQQIGM